MAVITMRFTVVAAIAVVAIAAIVETIVGTVEIAVAMKHARTVVLIADVNTVVTVAVPV